MTEARSGAGITIGGKTATASFKDRNTLPVVTPAPLAGPQRVTVTNPPMAKPFHGKASFSPTGFESPLFGRAYIFLDKPGVFSSHKM
jgi:hypothetical protein